MEILQFLKEALQKDFSLKFVYPEGYKHEERVLRTVRGCNQTRADLKTYLALLLHA
jgi:hypothetical protein